VGEDWSGAHDDSVTASVLREVNSIGGEPGVSPQLIGGDAQHLIEQNVHRELVVVTGWLRTLVRKGQQLS